MYLNSSPVQNIVTWNAVISGYAHNNLVKEALKCFEQMKDARVFNVHFESLCHGEVDGGWTVCGY
jgi:pentatricopeptide repeat protein